jgi:hypothetical protein
MIFLFSYTVQLLAFTEACRTGCMEIVKIFLNDERIDLNQVVSPFIFPFSPNLSKTLL